MIRIFGIPQILDYGGTANSQAASHLMVGETARHYNGSQNLYSDCLIIRWNYTLIMLAITGDSLTWLIFWLGLGFGTLISVSTSIIVSLIFLTIQTRRELRGSLLEIWGRMKSQYNAMEPSFVHDFVALERAEQDLREFVNAQEDLLSIAITPEQIRRLEEPLEVLKQIRTFKASLNSRYNDAVNDYQVRLADNPDETFFFFEGIGWDRPTAAQQRWSAIFKVTRGIPEEFSDVWNFWYLLPRVRKQIFSEIAKGYGESSM